MKRSEMVYIIFKEMYPEYNIAGKTQITRGYKQAKHRCNELLKKIEKAGMLPPRAVVDTEETYLGEEKLVIKNEWEPEDD